MSLNILGDLYEGSYNGVGFLIDSSSVAGGRKTVTHEFPNQDNRYVEDLGLLNETITIRGCVATESYFGSRDALKAAFETPGYGTLIHPFYGIRQCACTTYSMEERTSALGDLNFTATFLVAQELNFPAGGTANFQGIIGLANTMIGLLHSYYRASSSTYPNLGRSTVIISNTISSMVQTFKRTSTTYITRSEFQSKNTADFKVALDTFTKLAPSLSYSPQSFLDTVAPVYKTIDSITTTGRSGFILAKGLLDLEVPLIRVTPATFRQLAAVDNQKLVVNFSKIYAFALMTTNASITTFSTLDDYTEFHSSLNNVYVDIKTRVAKDPLVSPVLTALEDLWSATSKLMSQQIVNLPFVSTVQGRDLPVSVLTYSYYGSLDKVTAIQELNFPAQIDPSFLSGNVRLLSGQ